MPVVEEESRELLKRMTKEDVLQAMDLFDRRYRRDFEDTRWRRWVIKFNGKHYPPKDLLRCVIAILSNASYERASVIGGGTGINKYFERCGFEVFDTEQRGKKS